MTMLKWMVVLAQVGLAASLEAGDLVSDEGNDRPGYFHFSSSNDEQRVPKKR